MFKPLWTLDELGKGGEEHAQPVPWLRMACPTHTLSSWGLSNSQGCAVRPPNLTRFKSTLKHSACASYPGLDQKFRLFFALGLHGPLETATGQPNMSYSIVGLQLFIHSS